MEAVVGAGLDALVRLRIAVPLAYGVTGELCSSDTLRQCIPSLVVQCLQMALLVLLLPVNK